MSGDARIEQNSDELNAVERSVSAAGRQLSAAGKSLHGKIPGSAFGKLGAPIAAAGNTVGEALALALSLNAKLAEAITEGTAATRLEFERVEDEAVSRFTSITIGGE